MTVDSCNICGKTSSLMNCKRCKSVAYCSSDCQRQDWKTHKPTCQRKDFAGAPCDFCYTTENVEYGDVCFNCGAIFCEVCTEQNSTHDLSSGEVVVSLEPCPRCNKTRDFGGLFSDRKKLEKLIKESPRDPRLANWFIFLGTIFMFHDDDTVKGERKAKEHFLRAGQLGLGEGFTRVAEIHIKNRNWDEAKRFYQKGADRMHVIAISNLAAEASQGYFEFDAEFLYGEILQTDHRRLPDMAEAVRFLPGRGTARACWMLPSFG